MLLNRNKLIAYLAVLVFVLVGTLMPSHLSFTMTPSLKYRLFWLNNYSAKNSIGKGDYVMFEFSTKYINNGQSIKAIKEVVCIPGDNLNVDNKKNYYCNGHYIGTAKDTSLTGVKVDNFRYTGTVPEGSYFVMGHIKDSFDSKYYGFIQRSRIEKIAYPIL